MTARNQEAGVIFVAGRFNRLFRFLSFLAYPCSSRHAHASTGVDTREHRDDGVSVFLRLFIYQFC